VADSGRGMDGGRRGHGLLATPRYHADRFRRRLPSGGSGDSAYWSGATPAAVAQGEAAMVRALGLESAPDNACYLAQPNPESAKAGR